MTEAVIAAVERALDGYLHDQITLLAKRKAARAAIAAHLKALEAEGMVVVKKPTGAEERFVKYYPETNA